MLGPVQVDNKINTTAEISSELTLLNQQGSSVIQGSMQLIPVGRLDHLRPARSTSRARPSRRYPQFRFVVVTVARATDPVIGDQRRGRADAAVPRPRLPAPPDVQATDDTEPTTRRPDRAARRRRPRPPTDAARHHRGAAARRGRRAVRRGPGGAPAGRLRPVRRAHRAGRPTCSTRPRQRRRRLGGDHADHHDHPAATDRRHDRRPRSAP